MNFVSFFLSHCTASGSLRHILLLCKKSGCVITMSLFTNDVPLSILHLNYRDKDFVLKKSVNI